MMVISSSPENVSPLPAGAASFLHFGLVLDVHRGLLPVQRPTAAAADILQLGAGPV